MWARPIENIVNIKGTPCVLPAHTVYIPEYNYGILELTRQDVRTLLKKMVQSGYIAVNTKSKRTYITILESELYKYPQIKKNTTARASKTEPEKPAQTSEDFNFILNKIN
jgi:hypothetical protein